MRKPMIHVGVLAVVTVAGIWAAAHGADMATVPDVPAARQPGRIWTVAGLLVAAFSVWFCIRAFAHAWLHRNLLISGDGLAHWTVTPDEWAALTGRSPPRADVPVVIDQEMVVIGESCTPIPAGFSLLTYTRLSAVEWVEGPPGAGGFVLLARAFWTFRSRYILFVHVPVPDRARGEAQLAMDGLAPLIPEAQRERAERMFAAELAAARVDPDGGERLRTKRLLEWGLSTALFSGGGYALLSIMPASSGAPFSLAPVLAGLCVVGILMMVASFFSSR